MSGPDAFDGEIERLFARPPALDGGETFAHRVERRLARGSRIRTVVVGAAGLVGGVLAVQQAVGSGFTLNLSNRPAGVTTPDAGPTVAGGDWGQYLDLLQTLGMGQDLAALPSMPLFWLASAGLILAAAFTATRNVNA
ncbi:hypothetical protein [Brevundimonas sp.]|uniref:hypothetical protein n=1 Tax=Brevundimonas sp. TaxID=1871086 RepID=UPI0025CD6C33|nr:hypothetical protein [Brevundimonas sp.]